MSETFEDIKDPAQLVTGVVKSLQKLQVPLWIDGQNVVFEDGCVHKSPGYGEFFVSPSSDPVVGVQDVAIDGVPNLYWGDATQLYRFNGLVVTTDGVGYQGLLGLPAFQDSGFQDTGFAMGIPLVANKTTQWSMEAWGEWCAASNGIDPIQLNKGAGAGFQALTGNPPSSAEIIVRYKNYLLAFNFKGSSLDGVSDDPTGVCWCDTDNIEEWVDGDAGYQPIRDMGTEIIAARRMGDLVAAYSFNTMAVVQWIGAPYFFGAKKVLEGIGAVSKHCIVERDRLNYGVSKQGIWETDGTGFNYISPPYIRKWLQDNVNFDQSYKIAGYLNEDRTMIEWGVPSKGGNGNNDITIGYNYMNRSWTFKDYGFTSGIKKGLFPFPIFGTSTGIVCYAEHGVDANGLAMESFVQTKPFVGKGKNWWKSVDNVVVDLKDLVGTLEVFVGVQEDLNDAISWSQALNIDDGSQPDFGGLGLDGKYVSLKFRSRTLGSNWGLSSFQIEGIYTGMDY